MHFSCTQPHGAGAITVPILQMGKLSPRRGQGTGLSIRAGIQAQFIRLWSPLASVPSCLFI